MEYRKFAALIVKAAIMNVYIPVPCHEDWDSMKQEDKGRFCSLCQKKVIDFSGMTDDEVRHFFLNNGIQNTCGRFNQHQLAAPSLPHISLPRAWFEQLPVSRQLLYAIVLFFMLGISSCDFSGDRKATSPLTPAADTITAKATAGITPAPSAKTDTVTAPKPHKTKNRKYQAVEEELITGPDDYTIMGGIEAVTPNETAPAPPPELPIPPVTGKMIFVPDTSGR